MYAKQENVRDFLLQTEENYASRGYIKFANDFIVDNYQDFLDEFAKDGTPYKEGQKISNEDLARISAKVNEILTSLRDEMVKKGSFATKGDKTNSECLSAMLETTDYLFAMTMNTLGCPDMPPSFGPDVQKNIVDLANPAEFEMRKDDYAKANTQAHFDRQRKKDANVVRSNNSERMDFIKTKKASPLQVANLAAEYQALKQRQERHTRVWRFFHKAENERRTVLLNDMKEALEFAAGKGFDVDSKSPVDIAKEFHKRSIENATKTAFNERGILNRQKLDKDMFGSEALDNSHSLEQNADSKDKSVVNENEKLRSQIKIDSNEIGGKEDKLDFSNRAIEGPKEKELGQSVPTN